MIIVSAATLPLNRLRILRPGGLFVFLEPEAVNSVDTVALVSRIFPATIKSTPPSAGKKSIPKYSANSAPIGEEFRQEPTGVDGLESPETKIAADRVGIVSQRLDTLFVPYITGIAVKP